MSTTHLVSLALAVILISCRDQPATEERQASATAHEQTPGTPGLVAETISLGDWVERTKNAPGTILDVRTPGEVSRGAIPGAINIDFQGADFTTQLNELSKDAPVYVYCAAGGRSKRAMNQMAELGFTEVYDLKGGYSAWSSTLPDQ